MAERPEEEADHYSVLGVAPDADDRSIRAAYLALMKRAHPDTRGGSPADPTALNLAYHVLRDPRRRLAYDLAFRRRRGLAPAAASGGAAAVRIARRIPPPPPPVPWSQRLAMLACLVLLGAAIGLYSALPEPATSRAVAPSPDPDAAPSPPSTYWADGAMVDRAVDHLLWIRRFGQPADAARYSRTCFDELRSMPNPLLLDHCVAFDLAAGQWIGSAPAGRLAGFAERDLQAKHRAAARALAGEAAGPADRLRDIRFATGAALARRIDPAAGQAVPESSRAAAMANP